MDASTANPEERRFLCRCCVAHCGMIAHLDQGRVTGVSGDRHHPISGGYSCAKGRAIPRNHASPHRLSDPTMRGRETDWQTCLGDIAGTMATLLADGGPDCIARYSGMGLYTDSLGWWALDQFFTQLGSRQKYSTFTVDIARILRACELVIGFPFLPHWTPEDAETTLAILIGTNPGVSHGHTVVLSNPTHRFREFRKRGGELWVVDPRTTKTARQADRHLAPRPDTDVFLLAWLVREILEEGADQKELGAHCRPDEVRRLREAVAPFSLDAVASATDLPEQQLRELLATIRRHGRLAILSGTGVSFSSSGLVAEWLRLVLLIITGSLDRKGGMRFNVGGALAMERVEWTNLLNAKDVQPSGPRSRPELRDVLGERPSAALVDEIEAGEIRALIVAGGNPLASLPQPQRLRAALAELDLLVVIECFDTEITSLATHVLPSAWMLERPDLVLLSDRSQFSPAVLPVQEDRRQSWRIIADLAERLDRNIFDDKVGAASLSDEDVLQRYSATARFPLSAMQEAGTHGLAVPHVYGWVHDKVLPEGRWRLVPDDMPAALEAAWGLRSVTPRMISGRRMNSNNSAHYAENGETDMPFVRVSRDIAEAKGIVEQSRVTLSTPSGELVAMASVDYSLREGTIWIPHGWKEQNVNMLIDQANIDPVHGQPVQSGFAVACERLDE